MGGGWKLSEKGAGEVGGDNQVIRAGYGLDPNLALLLLFLFYSVLYIGMNYFPSIL